MTMQDNWYESNQTNENSWYAPGASPAEMSPKKKKHRRIRMVAIILCVAGAISGWVYHLQNRAQDAAPESILDPAAMVQDSFTLPDDYREYFSLLYGPPEEAAECNIPRVANYEDAFELVLAEKGTTALAYKDIYAKCAPSVVAIHAYVDADSTDSYYWGTGFIIREDGFILTNSHIVENSCRATVTLWDDSVYEALLVGHDSRNDVAVLKIEANNLSAVEFCDSDSMEIGETVVAIGNPLSEEFRNTMTEGILSGIGRAVSYNGATLELLQTSAPLNKGTSGGPLINTYGQVIGITNMKMNSSFGATIIEGVGFAIPSHTVKELTDSILAQGEVTGRPALGVVVGVIPQEAMEFYSLPKGLYITDVKNGSDCQAKGLVVGDILTAVNGETVTETQHVLDKIEPLGVGDTMVMTVWRDGETIDITVALVDVNQVY